MVYFTYIVDLITNIMTTIVIPIPFSEDKIFYFSIFSIIMGIIVLSIIVYFVTKLLGIETNIFWNSVSHDLNKGYYKIHRKVNSDGTNDYTISDPNGIGRIGKDTWRFKHK